MIPTANFFIKRYYSPREITLEYIGEVSSEGIMKLSADVETAFEIYQPDQITIKVNSPGGSGTALNHWIHCINNWKKRNLCIATHAGANSYSAGALMVTFGQLGKRKAHPLSSLLFHNPRINNVSNMPIQEEIAIQMATLLKNAQSSVSQMLNNHLIDALGPVRFAQTLCSRAAWLKSPAAQKSDSLANSFFQSNICPDSLALLESWAETNPKNEIEAEQVIEQWNQQLKELFHKDQLLNLNLAWALFLIDECADLPVLITEPIQIDSDNNHIEIKTQANHQSF